MNENSNNNPDIQAKSVISGSKEVKRKSLMLVFSIVLLVAALVYFAYAWYTKMSSINDLQFDVAQWDFRAQFQSGEVIANPFTNSAITDDKIAPGTEGTIPIKVQATQSNSDVDFYILVQDSYSEEFNQRIQFYYRNGDSTVRMPDKGDDYLVPYDNSNYYYAGTVTRGSSASVTLYWRWVYDLQEALQKGTAVKPEDVTDDYWNTMKAAANTMTEAQFIAAYPDETAAWDEFDTEVGKYPDAYVDDMNFKILIVGGEPEPSSSPGLNT